MKNSKQMALMAYYKHCAAQEGLRAIAASRDNSSLHTVYYFARTAARFALAVTGRPAVNR